MNLQKYIAESARCYNYRIKSIVPLEDVEMDWIERVAMKYQPLDITRPRRTMLQANPLDFKNTNAAEIYIVDLSLGLPASPYVLQKELQLALRIPESSILVRGSNDPTEVESERLVAAGEITDEAKKLGLTPSGLISDPTYSEVTPSEDLYGAVHNQKFLDYLRAVQKERDEARKVDPANPLFKWMDMPKQEVVDEGTYNENITGALGLGQAKEGDCDVAPEGNIDDRKRTYKRRFATQDGVTKMLSREVDTTKEPK